MQSWTLIQAKLQVKHPQSTLLRKAKDNVCVVSYAKMRCTGRLNTYTSSEAYYVAGQNVGPQDSAMEMLPTAVNTGLRCWMPCPLIVQDWRRRRQPCSQSTVGRAAVSAASALMVQTVLSHKPASGRRAARVAACAIHGLQMRLPQGSTVYLTGPFRGHFWKNVIAVRFG